MRRLVLQRSARNDLGDILRYLARRSRHPDVALRFVQSIRMQCRALASLPGTLGRARPELGDGRRSFAFRGYVIVFRYEPGVLRVLAVMEGHRAAKTHLDDPT